MLKRSLLIPLLTAFLIIGLGVFLYQIWVSVASAERKRMAETFELIVRHTADSVQQLNVSDNNIAGSFDDKQHQEKLAFAIGMNGNRGKMSMNFDEQPKAAPAVDSSVPVISAKTIKSQNIHFRPELVKTIHDFDVLLKAALTKQQFPARYTIDTVNPAGKYVQKANSQLQTQPFIVNYFDPTVYSISYQIPGSALQRRLLPYTGASALLVMLMGVVLALLYRSVRMQRQISQFRSSLFSNATHELKTPLTSLQLILDSFTPNGSGNAVAPQRNLAFAAAEIARMNLLVGRILSYGRMEKAQLALEKTTVHLAALTDEAVAALSMIIRERQAKVTCQTANDIIITGDRVLLTNMVISLLENAIRHTPGKAAINIHLARTDNAAEIIITDDGPGIATQYHKRVFEPFFRVPGNVTAGNAGHGLGLSFAMQVAQLHEGTIRLSSQPGRGSTFTVSLPLQTGGKA